VALPENDFLKEIVGASRREQQFAGSRSGVGNGGGTRHAGSLRCVGVKVAGWNDFDTVVLPVHEVHDIRSCAALTATAKFRAAPTDRPASLPRFSRTRGPSCALYTAIASETLLDYARWMRYQ
jgi:hypothetical protein